MRSHLTDDAVHVVFNRVVGYQRYAYGNAVPQPFRYDTCSPVRVRYVSLLPRAVGMPAHGPTRMRAA